METIITVLLIMALTIQPPVVEKQTEKTAPLKSNYTQQFNIEEDIPAPVPDSEIVEREPIYNFSIDYTEEEVYLLAQLITQEADGQPREGKIGVANVVLNRVLSEYFIEDNVTDVIYAEGQFSGAQCVKYVEPTEDALEIAQNVLDGKEYVFYHNTDVLFFRNPGEGNESDWGQYPWYVTIGDHAFYTKT